MRKFVTHRAVVPVRIEVELRDGFYYATSPWADREKHGLVTARSKTESAAVRDVLMIAGFASPQVEVPESTSALA